MKKTLCLNVAGKDFPRTSRIYGYFRKIILCPTAQITKVDSDNFNEIKWNKSVRNVLERQK